MKIQQFLQHHGIARNPFAEEDAQTDPVFKDYCIVSTYHPTWDKVYGDPADPATAIVFGEKGSGKTAMRMQIARHLRQYNQENPDRQCYVVEYDDFNPFLDHFRVRVGAARKRTDKVLSRWKLWDHMDAILSLGVTKLVDHALGHRPAQDVRISDDVWSRLDPHQARDLLLLAACYDQSMADPLPVRWQRLKNRLHAHAWRSWLPLIVGLAGTLITLLLLFVLMAYSQWAWMQRWWWVFPALLLAGWAWWLWRNVVCLNLARGIRRRMRVLQHQIPTLRPILMRFTASELAGQPLPNKDSTDDRYELLLKFQGILKSLGCTGIVVLVDRVDEPHLINGSAERMRALVWPMLDNKFLKHPGLGLKLMLPSELKSFVDREDRDFFQRARLDKQNMVPSFEWTPEALHDVASARLAACAVSGEQPSLRGLFDPAISDQRLLETMRSLRVPRHLFKFFYRLLVAHCNAHTDERPVWQIPIETFEATLAVYLRDQDAYDRGVGAG